MIHRSRVLLGFCMEISAVCKNTIFQKLINLKICMYRHVHNYVHAHFFPPILEDFSSD